MANPQEDLEMMYADVQEEREQRQSVLKRIPTGILVVFGILVIILVGYLFRDTENLYSILFVVGVICLVIYLVASKKVPDYHFLGEEEVIPIAVKYIERKMNILIYFFYFN